MKFLKVKIVLILIALVFVLFFFDDYDIIYVEKTAIITAVAIDYNNEKETDEYTVTAQIAVPEANDTNTESTRTELSGKGGTIGAAIKQIGDLSGWYPHLSFCNLIILGKDMCKTNVIKTLDYFTKTLRLQDSAMVILSETSAKELLETTTPLDKISSFAIQKILFKNKGFDADVASVDVKDFCLQYYDVGSSSFMPIVGAKSQFTEETGQSGGSGGGQGPETAGGEGGQGGGSNEESAREKKVFHANVTALFKEGRKVGELSPEETLVFNAMRQDVTGTTLELTNVKVGLNKPQNYLITVIKNKCASKVCASENGILFDVQMEFYCKISDRNAEASDSSFSKNVPLPKEVEKAAEALIQKAMNGLIETQIQTNCDFLRIERELFRKHNDYYARYKDNYLSLLKTNVEVTVSGQK